VKNIRANSLLSEILIVIVLVSCIPLGINTLPTPTIVPPVSHKVYSLVGIELIWIIENASVHRNYQDTALDSSTGKTCFLGNLNEQNKYFDHLICLESRSGKVLWNNYSGIHDEIEVTPDGIFVTYITPASVRKYDLQNGKLIWKNKKLGRSQGFTYLYFQDGQVEMLLLDERTVVLNATDGKAIRTIEGNSVFVSTRDEILIDFDGLHSMKANTDQMLWKYEDTKIEPAPLFTDNKIFVRRKFSKTTYALDRNTGALLWEIPKILGNYAYSSSKHVVYALRENGELLAIDENSGKEVVIAKFSPAPFIYSDGIHDFGYQLSYDDEEKILIVSTGDSSQLFAFQEK
jgi:hypothetical protein